MEEEQKKKVEETLNQSKVFLTMKGNPDFPQCGFSQKVVGILRKHNVEFKSLNVFEDPEMMDAIKEYADWPTTPMLFVDGKFVGGCDIIVSMDESGELEKVVSQ